jgi:hypothetical protein
MSRSYKKTPRSGDKKDKFLKRYANHKLRRQKLTSDLQHNSYKKNYCSWEICDYETVGTSFEQYWSRSVSRWHEWWYRYEPYPDRDEVYQEWMRWFKRK